MIDLNSYKLALEKKWGLFKKKDHYFSQGDMPFVSKVAKLNVFFQPLSDEQIAYISSIFNISLPEDLVNFWRQTNNSEKYTLN